MDSESDLLDQLRMVQSPKVLYAGYYWGWCNICDTIYSICKGCGNNSCNPAPIDQNCAQCRDNYDITDLILAHSEEVEFIKERINNSEA